MSLTQSTNLQYFRGNKILVHPAIEPVTADQLRDYLRQDAANMPDAEAVEYIAEARAEIERVAGIALITQTWLLAIDQWPMGKEPWWDGVRQGAISELRGRDSMSSLNLPRFPLQSVSGVNVYDRTGDATALVVADTFVVDAIRVPGRLTIKSGASWPSATRENNAIEVTYIAGYGDTAADVPAPLVRAVKQLAAHNYSHRGECVAGDAVKESGAGAILMKYKDVRI